MVLLGLIQGAGMARQLTTNGLMQSAWIFTFVETARVKSELLASWPAKWMLKSRIRIRLVMSVLVSMTRN